MDSHKKDRKDRGTAGSEHSLLSPVEYATGEVRKATRWWWLYALLGLASIVLGVTALASRINATATLVAVFAGFLIYSGVFEIAFAATVRRHTWLGVLTGVASIAAGFVALAWPGITVYVLAVFVAASLIAWGIYRIYLSFVDPIIKPRAVTLIEGLALIALGVLALALPDVSILALAVLVGVFSVLFGVFSFVGSLHMLDLHHALKKAADHAGDSKNDDATSGVHRAA